MTSSLSWLIGHLQRSIPVSTHYIFQNLEVILRHSESEGRISGKLFFHRSRWWEKIEIILLIMNIVIIIIGRLHLSCYQMFKADLTERVKQLYTEAWLNLLSSSSPQADSSLSFQWRWKIGQNSDDKIITKTFSPRKTLMDGSALCHEVQCKL